MSKKPVKKKKEVQTTGHEWDGIQELNNPLPRWWVWVFYTTIVWAAIYSVAYPAWPLVSGATEGFLGFSTRGQVAAEIKRFEDMNAPLNAELAEADLATIDKDSGLYNFAIQSGRATFATWCSQCHGSGANGAEGYTRFSEMPAFGEDYLEDEEIANVVAYVMSLSDMTAKNGDAAAGAEVFADNCASCHMDDGTGDREQGAPNLSDFIWLYGDDEAAITSIVSEGPYGVMPAWSAKLTESQIKAVSLYVHQLGGGE